MRTSSNLKPNGDLILYHDELFEGERKKLPFLVAGSLLFVGGGFWVTTFGQEGGWIVVLFSSLILLTFLVLLTWGPFLAINEQRIYIRPNPLLPRITFQWDEVTAMIPSLVKNNPYLGFALSPAYLETFLRHQSPLNKLFLGRKLNPLHPMVLLRADQLPCSVEKLFASLQKQYPTQIQQYSIQFGDTSIFDEALE
jgi:hypothetical protein